MASKPGHTARIFSAAFRPDSDSQFVTVGIRHCSFWNIAGSTLVPKRPRLPDNFDIKMQTMLSIAFGSDHVTYTGSISGAVFVWKDCILTRVVQDAHSGPVFDMFTTLSDGLIVTGAKQKVSDKKSVKLWDQDMKRSRQFSLNCGKQIDVVKAVCRHKGKVTFFIYLDNLV